MKNAIFSDYSNMQATCVRACTRTIQFLSTTIDVARHMSTQTAIIALQRVLTESSACCWSFTGGLMMLNKLNFFKNKVSICLKTSHLYLINVTHQINLVTSTDIFSLNGGYGINAVMM